MGLELMVGFDNKEKSRNSVQIGFRNYASAYSHAVLQLGLINNGTDVPAHAGAQLGVKNKIQGSLYGVQIGILSEAKEIRGIQIGALNFGNHYGVQVGVLNGSDGFGLQVGALNVSEKMSGLQAGLLNSCFCVDKGVGQLDGVQIGVWNYARDLGGVQAGLVNYVKEELDGLQVGAFNRAGEDFNGVQVGLICYAADGNYLQLGFLTIRGGDRPWYNRISPLVGVSANRKK